MQNLRGTIQQANESTYNGWIVGHMQTGIAQTNGFEIKLWYYPDFIDYPKKEFLGTECIVIYGGIIILHLEKNGEIAAEELIGKNGDYIILEPGIVKRVEVKEKPAFGVTVRWPSLPGVNKVL